MTTRLAALQTEIRKLRPADRIRLAEHILATLDPAESQEHERLWLAEAERRLADFHAGRTKTTGAAAVLKKARTLTR